MSDQGNEASLIQRVFAPLTLGRDGAYGLHDDAAFLPSAASGLIVTQDQVIEGTHFLPGDPLDMIARRLVRRNLSDMIAKGGVPTAAFLSLAWPMSRDRQGIADFARGLGEDLDKLCGQCPLMGGDTSTTKGDLVASLTLLGHPLAANGRPVLRSGARVGDVVAVTGVIGDAYLGLQVRQGTLDASRLRQCAEFSLAPSPPDRNIAGLIARFAHASIDVSDGLILDASRVADASGIAIVLDLDLVPMSQEAKHCRKCGDDLQLAIALATGGDDYQPLITLSPNNFEDFSAACKDMGVECTQVGMCTAGAGIHLRYDGVEVANPAQTGWEI